jgi:integrase
MAGRKEAWKLTRDERSGNFVVRFRHAGKRFMRSTGESNARDAARAAESIYQEVTAGKPKASPAGNARQPDVSREGLDVLAAEWLTAIESSIDRHTYKLFTCYVTAHWIPFFGTLEGMMGSRTEDYWRHRLRSVQVQTVRKELSALRSFLGWCQSHAHVEKAPVVTSPGKRAVGTVRWKRQTVCLTEEQVMGIIARLPGTARSRKHPDQPPYVVRDRFIFGWETGMRPEMVDVLSVPDNYRPGQKVLTLHAQDDKNRMARALPLTERAREALDRACPASGVIFGEHDYRPILRRAAREAGIDPAVAARVTAHCFRHSRITHWAETSGNNLAGVQYLAGHTKASTTEKYIKTSLRAAEAVLGTKASFPKASAPGAPPKRSVEAVPFPTIAPPGGQATATTSTGVGYNWDTARDTDGNAHAPATPNNTNSGYERDTESLGVPREVRVVRKKTESNQAVRGGGLEPPWLLTASTSSYPSAAR